MTRDIPTRIRDGIELGRIVRPCLPYYYSPTNEPFVTFRMAYNKDDTFFIADATGNLLCSDIYTEGVHYSSDRDVVNVFCTEVMAYYSDPKRSGYFSPGCVVYWRVEPTIEFDIARMMNVIYARFIITSHMDESIKYWRDQALESSGKISEAFPCSEG